MKVKDKKSVQSLLKVDDLKQNKIYLNKKTNGYIQVYLILLWTTTRIVLNYFKKHWILDSAYSNFVINY